LNLLNAISQKWCKIGAKLVLTDLPFNKPSFVSENGNRTFKTVLQNDTLGVLNENNNSMTQDKLPSHQDTGSRAVNINHN